MNRLAVTATDLARAGSLLARIAENDRSEIAKLLAELREEILTCAAIRAERHAASVLHDAAVSIAHRLNDENNPRMTCTAPNPSKTGRKKRSAGSKSSATSTGADGCGDVDAASAVESEPSDPLTCPPTSEEVTAA